MAKQKKFMSHILTGISYMIPVVVAGGILGALAKAFGGWNIGSAVEAGATPFSNLNPFTWIGFWWGVNKLSSYAMDFAVAVMTAGAAYSIAGRPGIVPGMVIGYCSSQSKAGFLGGMLMAFIIGYVVNWMKGWKLPKWCEGLKPVMIMFYIYLWYDLPVHILNPAVLYYECIPAVDHFLKRRREGSNWCSDRCLHGI